MNQRYTTLASVLALALPITASSGCFALEAPGASAENNTIYINGHIYTDKGVVSRFVERNGVIVAVGDDANLQQTTANAHVVDLKGKTVFPSFADFHVHPGFAGKYLNPCKVAADATLEVMTNTVADCVKNTRPGDWIYGSGWSKSNPDIANFNHRMLDSVSPQNPVVLADLSGHDALVNGAALSAAGFTSQTPEIQGGTIERDAKGQPTGVLREAPAAKLRYSMPPSDEEATRQVKQALNILSSKGITTIVDAAIRLPDVKAYTHLADAGQLNQHVSGCMLWNKDSPDFDTIYQNRAEYSRGNFALNCVKVFMDGTPNESHSAAMQHPYEKDADDNSPPTSGQVDVVPAILNSKVTEWDKAGLSVKFHCGGDEAVKVALDAIEAAHKTNGTNNVRHSIAHVVFISAADLKRANRLNVILEFSPVLWYPNPVSDGIVRATGKARVAHIWPVKTALANNSLVISGSDWPGAEDPNPFLAIETLVTRKAPGNTGPALGVKEAISLRQAIGIHLPNALDVRGKSTGKFLSAGDKANFIILDRDPFEVPIGEVHDVRVLKTVFNGTTVFDSASEKH